MAPGANGVGSPGAGPSASGSGGIGGKGEGSKIDHLRRFTQLVGGRVDVNGEMPPVYSEGAGVGVTSNGGSGDDGLLAYEEAFGGGHS